MVTGDDAAVEDLELFLVGHPAFLVGLVVDDVAVDGVDHALQPEARAHVVLVNDQGAGAGHHTAQHHLLDGLDAQLGAMHLLLEVVDLVLHQLEAHAVGRARVDCRGR
jgi:hypothetical protein